MGRVRLDAGDGAVDVDLDGYEDILTTTGHPWDLMDAETPAEKPGNRLTGSSCVRPAALPLPRCRCLTTRSGTGATFTFEDASDVWHLLGRARHLYGAWPPPT